MLKGAKLPGFPGVKSNPSETVSSVTRPAPAEASGIICRRGGVPRSHSRLGRTLPERNLTEQFVPLRQPRVALSTQSDRYERVDGTEGVVGDHESEVLE